MTVEEYRIYLKKRQVIDKNRDFNEENRKKQEEFESKQVRKIIEDF